MTLLDAALALARAGHPCFLLSPGSKLPLVPFDAGGRGVLDATTNADAVERWWTAVAAANIGLATGHTLDVIDLDEKKGKSGTASLAALIAAHGPIPPCPIARTPSGGYHLFFRADPARPLANRTGLGAKDSGIDVRAVGGYVVAAPSSTPEGAYEWLEGAPELADAPPMPEWLRTLVGAHTPRAAVVSHLEHAPLPPATEQVLAAARAALVKHGPSVFGASGNEHAFRAGAILLNDFGLTWEEAEPLAHEWNEGCKCPARPDGWDLDRLEQVFANGERYASRPRGSARLLAEVPRPGPVTTYAPVRADELAESDEDGYPDPYEDEPVTGAPVRLNPALIRDRLDRATTLGLLKRNEKGAVLACGANASLLVRQLYHGEFRFNLLEKTVDASRSIFRRETPDTLPKAVADFLTFDPEVDAAFSSAQLADALLLVGMENAFNPLAEYLRACRWDGVFRLDRWLEVYARARLTDDEGVDVSPYVRAVGARWMIAAAARALYPGCKVDTVLVLEGLQGLMKSTVFDILGGPWFADTPLRIGDKDANLGAGSSWIIELAELASLRKAESESQKAFLTAKVDTFRVPYGRASQRFPRACVFGGTTNAKEYLFDRTGNRRYWCVRVEQRAEDLALRRDRDQLWAEAVHRLHHASAPELCRELKGPHEQGPGERWWFEPHEQLVADTVTRTRAGEDAIDSFAERLRAWLLTAPKLKLAEGLTTSQIADEVFLEPRARHTQRLLSEVGTALRECGLTPRGEHRPRRYYLSR